MGSSNSKVTTHARDTVAQIIQAHPQYEVDLQTYIFSHVSSSSSTSQSDSPEYRLRSKLLLDFTSHSGCFTARLDEAVQKYCAVNQIKVKPEELGPLIRDAVEAQAERYQAKMNAESAAASPTNSGGGGGNEEKERQVQEELKKTWDEMEITF